MKILATVQSGIRFVCTPEEAAVLGDYAQLTLTGNWWLLKPCDPPSGGRKKGIAKRRVDAGTYRFNFAAGTCAIEVVTANEIRLAIELDVKQNGPGYMMHIPDQLQVDLRVAERREEPPSSISDLKDAIALINHHIASKTAEAFIRDDRLVVRAVMEL